jgi:hypothetical protein
MGKTKDTMIYIAHRGLFDGPDINLENRPQQIELALSKGYHCEIDVWYVDHKWFLGHDFPDYEVQYKFLEQHNLWLHTKNLDALYLMSFLNNLNFFWHESDSCVLTSKGYIWTQPGKPLTPNSIMVMPEYIDNTLKNVLDVKCMGICSDYVNKIKEIRCD